MHNRKLIKAHTFNLVEAFGTIYDESDSEDSRLDLFVILVESSDDEGLDTTKREPLKYYKNNLKVTS